MGREGLTSRAEAEPASKRLHCLGFLSFLRRLTPLRGPPLPRLWTRRAQHRHRRTFREVPHQRLVQLRNGLERDSSSACPPTESLHFLVTSPPGGGANGGTTEKGLLSVATPVEEPILLEASTAQPHVEHEIGHRTRAPCKQSLGRRTPLRGEMSRAQTGRYRGPRGILCRQFKKEGVNTNRVRNEDRFQRPAATNDVRNGCARGGLLRSIRQAPTSM